MPKKCLDSNRLRTRSSLKTFRSEMTLQLGKESCYLKQTNIDDVITQQNEVTKII